MANDNSLILGALCALTILASADAHADTYITYDDGSTYTLKENERVFITERRLFGLTQTEGVFSFGEQPPNDKRDYDVPSEDYNDYPVGSEKWCELYVPWSEGMTFNMQWWLRSCQD